MRRQIHLAFDRGQHTERCNERRHTEASLDRHQASPFRLPSIQSGATSIVAIPRNETQCKLSESMSQNWRLSYLYLGQLQWHTTMAERDLETRDAEGGAKLPPPSDPPNPAIALDQRLPVSSVRACARDTCLSSVCRSRRNCSWRA